MSVYVLEGLRPWVIQRVSAVYLALFVPYALYYCITAEQLSFDNWRAWLFEPVNTVIVALFVIALLLHTWIGVRDIVLDYVHNIMLRILALTLIVGVLTASGLWTFRLLLLSVVY